MKEKTSDLSRFFAPDAGSSATYLLPPEESRHAVKVLRLQPGDLLELVNGKGSVYTCRIVEYGKKGTLLEIAESKFVENRSNYKLHLAISPTKNIERFEWLLEKATEIGIDQLTPLVCQRSERRELNYERLQKILVASMKQSLNVWLPRLNPITPIGQFLEQPFNGLSAIAHCLESKKTDLKELVNLPEQFSEYRILIGPEGDFSQSELDLAFKAGFKPLSLGNSRLRTETAGLVACTELAMLMR